MDRCHALQRYRVERYLAGITTNGLRADLARLAEAAGRLAAEGATIRYLGSTFAPDEESCFSTFESDAQSVVERVCLLAQFADVRITIVKEFPPDSSAQPSARNGA